MATTAGPRLAARAEERWFRRPAYVAATRVWHETVMVQGAASRPGCGRARMAVAL
jgi:hypothetical protein